MLFFAVLGKDLDRGINAGDGGLVWSEEDKVDLRMKRMKKARMTIIKKSLRLKELCVLGLIFPSCELELSCVQLMFFRQGKASKNS